MYYRLLVMKIEDNPAFDPVKADEWSERQVKGYGTYGEPPCLQREIGTRQLDVVVNEHEYMAIKQAVLSTFK